MTLTRPIQIRREGRRSDDAVKEIEIAFFYVIQGVLLMRLTRLALLFAGVFTVASCKEAEITRPNIPPTAVVRYINALSDTGSVDIRMIDQVDFSAYGIPVAFRGGTAYQLVEAKTRHIRVFPTSLNASVTSQIIHDTTIAFTAGTRVTLLLTGSARSKTARFVVITDNTDPPAAGQIGVRLVNASTGAVNGYAVTAVGDAITGTPAFANVAPLTASAYINRNAGAVAVRATDVGSTTANASVAGPAAPAPAPGDVFPAAGVTSAFTRLSAYYFPRGVAGSPQNAVTAASIVWFVDRNPCDTGTSC